MNQNAPTSDSVVDFDVILCPGTNLPMSNDSDKNYSVNAVTVNACYCHCIEPMMGLDQINTAPTLHSGILTLHHSSFIQPHSQMSPAV